MFLVLFGNRYMFLLIQSFSIVQQAVDFWADGRRDGLDGVPETGESHNDGVLVRSPRARAPSAASPSARRYAWASTLR